MEDNMLLKIANCKKTIYLEKLSLLENYKLNLLNKFNGNVWTEKYLVFFCHKLENNLDINKYEKFIFCNIIMNYNIDILNDLTCLKKQINETFAIFKNMLEMECLIMCDCFDILTNYISNTIFKPTMRFVNRIYDDLDRGVRVIWDI